MHVKCAGLGWRQGHSKDWAHLGLIQEPHGQRNPVVDLFLSSSPHKKILWIIVPESRVKAALDGSP